MLRKLTLNSPEVGPSNSEDIVLLARTEYTYTKASVVFQVGHYNVGDFVLFRQSPVIIEDTDSDPTAFTDINNEFDVKDREDAIFDYLIANGYIGSGNKSDE